MFGDGGAADPVMQSEKQTAAVFFAAQSSTAQEG